MYSVSTSDLHSVQSSAQPGTSGTAPERGSVANVNDVNGEAGRLRGFILATKALERDAMTAGKKAKLKAGEKRSANAARRWNAKLKRGRSNEQENR